MGEKKEAMSERNKDGMGDGEGNFYSDILTVETLKTKNKTKKNFFSLQFVSLFCQSMKTE